ncbi:MAG: hypothetical protein JW862_03930, partial [Anaerolineales bacterium]|nr:hypothetical protein [Anaerolineales bacterium]
QGEARVEFIPSNGGVYKAYVTVLDEQGNEARSAAYMWVTSDDYVPWRVTEDRRIDLVADRDVYEPGDTAEILIASPFSGENYALVTVERGQIRQQDVIRLASNSVVYRLPITADWAPNVYVSVVVIKGAQRDGIPDFRMGITELAVDTGQQTITVEITPDRAQAGPGEQVTYNIRTTDYQGEPVQAELSISVADLATLSLAEPNSPPILDYFYGERSLNVRTVVPIVLSIEHYLETLEDQLTDGLGGGSGGGKGVDEFGVFDVRQDFPDTAFWEAHILTDLDGQAEITVTLPDNLTIWRLDGRAITLDTRVGDALVDLRSTKPLLIRPQTPRFFVNGDRVTLGAAIHNNSAEDLAVTVALEAGGVTVNSNVSQQVDIPAGGQAYVTWQVTVQVGVARVDLLFTALGGEYSDATRPTLGTLDGQGIPVYRYEAPETVGTSGLLSASEMRTEGISLPSGTPLSAGDLTVHLAPSLAAGMLPGLDYLKHYPYECVEQTISRFLPNVLTVQALRAAGLSDPALEAALDEQVGTALQRLYNWQRADGGWGWWPQSERSDALTSAYVVMGLVEAQNAGFTVSNSTLQRALNYLRGSLRSVAALDSQTLLNRQAFVLYVLARAGEPQPSQTGQLFDIRQSLSLYARAYLAEALYRVDPDDPRLDTLLSDFSNAAIRSASGTHWEEDWDDYWNWNTDTRTTAVVLATLVRVWPESELNPNAVRWLMVNRSEGHWATTQETAWSLIALTGWLTASGELHADYNWAVGLNGDRLADGVASSEQILDEWTVAVDLSQLLVDTVNRLTIGRDAGDGNLYYTAFLTLDLPVEQLQPLDRGLTINRQYYFPADRSNPISQAARGDLLLARLTLVVPHDLHYVIVRDPLPAGLEAVDSSLLTNPDVTAPEAYDLETQWRQGWGWWYFQHVEFRDEAVVLSADYLPAGTYVYTYLVRAGTAGEFRVIPPTAQEFYFPDVYGRGAGSLFTVQP